MRREFPMKVRAAAMLRCGGNCEECGRKLVTGDIEYDHILADGLGGEPTLENCKVICRGCHKAKTRGDVARTSKADMQRKKHLGIKKPSSFQSRFKRRMDGTVIHRDSGEPA